MVSNENNSIISMSIDEEEILQSEICSSIIEEEQLEDKNYRIIKKFYSEFEQIFEEKKANKLPPHRPYDISIDLFPGSQLY